MSRILAAATALLVLTACGEGSSSGHEKNGADRSSGPVGYAFDAATQAEAQVLLDRAEAQAAGSSAIHATAEWSLDTMSVKFDLVVDMVERRSRQLMDYATERGLVRVESVIDEEYLYSFMSQGSDTMPCWVRLTAPSTAAFVPAAVLMTLEPVAQGFATDGPPGAVVVELLLDEAVAAAMPKLAGQVAQSIDPTATIDAVAVVVDDRYASVRYRLADMVKAVTEGGSGIPELEAFGDVLGPEREVVVTYVSYDAERPVLLPDGPFADLDAAASGGAELDDRLVCDVA